MVASCNVQKREKLQGLIEAQHAAKDSSAAAETDTTTEDMSAVTRAPPCACWAKLRTISELQATFTNAGVSPT